MKYPSAAPATIFIPFAFLMSRHVKRNGRGPTYWTTCEVTACEPGREFAFGVGNGDVPLNVWRYRLKPAADLLGAPPTSAAPARP